MLSLDNNRTFAVDRHGVATVHRTEDFTPGRYPRRRVGAFAKLAGAAIAGVAAGSFLVAPAVQNAPVEPAQVWPSDVSVQMFDTGDGVMRPAACVMLDEFTQECITDGSGTVHHTTSTLVP